MEHGGLLRMSCVENWLRLHSWISGEDGELERADLSRPGGAAAAAC